VIQFLSDNFYLIAVALAGASYAIARRATGKRDRAATSAWSGIGPALTAGLLSSALLTISWVVLNPLLVIAYSGEQLFDLLRPLWLSTAGVTTLAVLTVFAIWPARPGDRSAATGRALTGGLVATFAILMIGGAIGSANGREAEAERLEADAAETRAIEARSAALSIGVTVVDARLAEPSQYGGRIVTHLSLDIHVRSMNDIQLIDGESGANHWMNFSPETISTMGVEPVEELALPTHLPAGFDASYRLEVPIDELTWSDVAISGREPLDQFTTGPWMARLSLYGAHDPGTPEVIYTTTTPFIVAETP